MKKLLTLLVIFAFCGIVSAAGPINHLDSIDFPVVETGDTASITTIEPLYAVMGFAYIDTFSYGVDTADYETITWTAPMQTMRLTIGSITATPTLIDTTVLIMVQCTVQFEAETLGFDYETDLCATATLEDALDSIVTVFNRTTNLKDSILAQDSGTYIKLVSKHSEAVNTKPWSVSFISSAGAPTDSCDTVSPADTVTIAMVCDSMSAAINANDSISVYAIAANSGDTAYTITALDVGLQFYDSTLNPADTHGTVTRTQANVTSKSRFGDTVNIIQGAGATSSPVDWAGLHGTIIIQASPTTTQGIGLSDSVYMFLSAFRSQAGNMVYSQIDGDSCAACPCTLRFLHPATTAGTDTLFKDGVVFHYEIADTASDTTAKIKYPRYWDFKITDR